VKLVRRLTLYLLGAIGAVFALDAYLSLSQHLALFDADLRHDERILGRALGRAVELAWRDRGERQAIDLVREVSQPEGGIRIRLVFLDDAPGSEFGPGAPPDALAAIRAEPTLTQVRDERSGGDGRIFTYVRLAIPGERSAAVELSESLADEHDYRAARIHRELETAVAMILACGLVAWIVGVRVVGRPIRELVEKSRRIGSGDFSGPLHVTRRDELAQLAGEMNVMAEHLDAAARRLAAESSARIAALEQLHHAERLSTVGKLASGIAHELGTPLNVVSGRAQMIASGEIDEPHEVRKVAGIVIEQVERITRIVRQLLDFSRRSSPEKRAIDAGALARQTRELLAPLAERRRIGLCCSGPDTPIGVFADPGQLQQALTNLVVNAIHASRPGGQVRIRVEAQDRVQRPVGGGGAGPHVALAVEDDGDGIAPDRLHAVFDPFYTTKAVGEGTGLGLSVAYGIAHDHGGWIDVRSELGRGSCFRIWLPRRGDESAADRR
jgi:signal transduction histidine kinase